MAYRSRHSLGQIQLAPIAGSIAGNVIGDLFSGGHHPATDVPFNAQTPRGVVVIINETSPNPPGSQMIFYQWAQQGHLDWLHSIATTGSGPKWTDPSGNTAYSGYGSSDKAAALALYNGFAGVSSPITGAPSQGAQLPAQLPVPAATSAAGIGLALGVGLGAAVLVAMFTKGRGRRRNPGPRTRAARRSRQGSHHARRRR